MKLKPTYLKVFRQYLAGFWWLGAAIAFTACSRTVDIALPPTATQVVVDGSIENGVPPIIILSKTQQFFSGVDLNDLNNYFIHGASITVTGSDGSQTHLQEFCLNNLNIPPSQSTQLLSALGYTSVDSNSTLDICAYSVPDIINYYLTGTCSFEGKVNTTYKLNITAPPFTGHDSIHITSTTTIPTPIGIDSLGIRAAAAPYSDSMAGINIYANVPDSFNLFIRFWTKIDSEPFYTGLGGSVYDDRMFTGLNITVPLERGQPPTNKFDLNTDTYFWKGDTVTLKWSNIDGNTYNFFYTLENDGGSSPFSSPVKVISNINNGLGVWAGYGTKYYTIVVPH